MRGTNTVSDEQIAKMRLEGLSSIEISNTLKSSGIEISSSGIRMKDGWKNYQLKHQCRD